MGRRRNWARRCLYVLGVVALFQTVLALHNKGPLPPLERLNHPGHVVLASDGSWLSVRPAKDGRLRLPARLDRVSPLYLDMLMMWEDQRWSRHRGVDSLGLLRAAVTSAKAGRVVSGGSTLSMQAARLLRARSTSTIPAKLAQISDALRLEAQTGKTRTLEAYLTLLPCGGRYEGIEICSRIWFGRDARTLSAAEAALMVAMPQSPETRRPDKHPDAARRARNRVLHKAHATGLLSDTALQEALATPLPARPRPLPADAQHLSAQYHAAAADTSRTTVTLDADLQRQLQAWRSGNLGRLPPETELGVVLMDWRSGCGRGHLGARAFSAAYPGGMVDHSRAIRSPGSALKPFVHALAYDRRIVLPGTLVPDLPASFGAWHPSNIDGEWRGWLTADEGLRASRNLPVLHMAEKLGMTAVSTGLNSFGLNLHGPDGAVGDLPMVLGGVGVDLQSLTQAYAALAGGQQRLHWIEEQKGDHHATPVVSTEAAHAVLSALAPETGPTTDLAKLDGLALALKTGTSHGQRDGWAVGIVGPYALGIWVGRSDGKPVPGLSGIGFVAQLWRDLALTLPIPEQAPRSFSSPLTGQHPPQGLQRLQVQQPSNANAPQSIVLSLGTNATQIAQGTSLPLEITGGKRPFRLLINQKLLSAKSWRRTQSWRPAGPGFWIVTLIDAEGTTASLNVEVVAE